jgi:GET complex subunit GET2
MSRTKPRAHDPFQSIDVSELSSVAGGASRVTARSNSSNDQLTAMMTQITQSIQALSQNNSQSDPMQMMMMMMMMGGMGGGGGGAPAAAPPPAAPPAPVINISTTVKRHGW